MKSVHSPASSSFLALSQLFSQSLPTTPSPFFSSHRKNTMKLFQDAITEDEMFSDAFPMYAHTILCAGVMD